MKVKAVYVAAALAASLIFTLPAPAAAAATGGGSAQQRPGLDLKQGQAHQARQAASLVATPCDTLFKSQSSPNRSVFNELEAVSATTPNDVWAAGFFNAGGNGAFDHALIAHSNGSTWTSTALPQTGNGNNDLTGIYAADPNDVWAVGNYQNGSVIYALGWHWNGTGWTRVTMPQPSTTVQALSGVSGVSGSDLWAVGLQGVTGATNTLAMHWNGSTWTAVATVSTGFRSILENVYARASNDVWAAGYTQATSSSPFQVLIEHWDGSNWSVVSGVNPVSGDDVLFNVSATSSTDAWAAGYTDTGSNTVRSTLIEHWNGTAWSAVSSPNVGTGWNELIGVNATSSTNAWAFGYSSATTDTASATLVEHWDGSSWSTLTSDSPGTGSDLLVGGALLPGNEVFAVGGGLSASNTSEGTVVEHFQLPAPTGVIATDAATGGTATISWTNPVCDGGFSGTSFLITAHDGCTVQGSLLAASSPASFSGLTNDSPFNFTVQLVGTTLGPETPSAASAMVTLSGGATATEALSACSAQHYQLSNPSSQTFTDIDSTNLALTTTTAAAPQTAVITGNVDLFTTSTGLNQDVGVFVSGGTGAFSAGKVVAWKESGGYGGTLSPNAAAVQAIIPLEASTAYTFKLQWKGNKPVAGGTIQAGGGPLPGMPGQYSPTRLSVRIVPAAGNTVQGTTSNQLYGLTGSDGSAWTDMDPANLSEQVTTASDMTAVITGNADLYTGTTGLNQDIGINVDGTLVAWKESGGFAGTFSPNAAFVSVAVTLTAAGSPHTIKLQWKTNKPEGTGHIYAGAGPWPSGSGLLSPTSLAVALFSTPSDVTAKVSAMPYQLTNSDGAGWTAMDTTNLEIPSLTPGVIANYTYDVSANSDLWTKNTGLNQDLGIFVSGGAYGTGTLVVWKESGGYAGTFSPNAAYADAILHLQSGVSYTLWIAWKTNKPSGGGTIVVGAGKSGAISPTSLKAVELSSP